MRSLPWAFAISTAAVVATPASATARDWPVRGFERVQLDAAADVRVHAGGGFAVHAEGPPEIVSKLTAEVRDGTLFLGWSGSTMRLRDGDDLRIDVTMPLVAGGGVKGVGSIVVDRAEAPLVVFAIEGTGSIDVAAIRADRTAISLKGVGSIEVAGTTRALDVRRSGMGSVDAARLRATAATLTSTGMGSLTARVEGPVSVVQSGMGSIDVTGAPRCTVRKSGMGSVSCGRG